MVFCVGSLKTLKISFSAHVDKEVDDRRVRQRGAVAQIAIV